MDPDHDAPMFYVRDQVEIAACCNIQDVPDVMARSYRYIHEKIENIDSKIIHVSLEEYKLMLDIGTIWLMHWSRHYTPSAFPGTAPGDSVVFRLDETIEWDMAGPSGEPTDELGDSGPILRFQWKRPRTYAKASSTGQGYRDSKYGKKERFCTTQTETKVATKTTSETTAKTMVWRRLCFGGCRCWVNPW
jgi:hypothetical protein